MATVKDITTLCKAGDTEAAYQQAMTDYLASPDDVWCQRGVGWALYYLIKADADNGNYADLLKHLEELSTLERLRMADDHLIFDNVLFKLGAFIKNHLVTNAPEALAKLSDLFVWFRSYDFPPSKGYSYLLQTVIKFKGWPEMTDFLDWWNLDKLTQEDYTPYVNVRGQKMITVAERAFITKSKALLSRNDVGRIEEFLPQLNTLMEEHPEMMYPGYFYGKLLLAIGSDTRNELKVVLPFARKKAGEFWVWDLLSTIFQQDDEKQLACLLRAVSCKAKEGFLGKVREKLAQLYIRHRQLDRAKYHIDALTRCYVTEGWRLPPQIDVWIHEGWISSVTANATAPIDFQAITDAILCEGTDESVAVVSYVDPKSNRVSLIYGHQQKAVTKLRFKVGVGVVLRINYLLDADGRLQVLNACPTLPPPDSTYLKVVTGTVSKRDDKDFAFLRFRGGVCFLSALCVKKYAVHDGESIRCLIAMDYDKKKDAWNWSCLSVNR